MPTHRQEPKPHNAGDARWAVIARAAELVDYIRHNKNTHITEVKLIEAIDDLREVAGGKQDADAG